MEKIKLGISTCLLGENVRYDGGHKYDIPEYREAAARSKADYFFSKGFNAH
jgi:uncharacterized protein YbbK (DUF523 family)